MGKTIINCSCGHSYRATIMVLHTASLPSTRKEEASSPCPECGVFYKNSYREALVTRVINM